MQKRRLLPWVTILTLMLGLLVSTPGRAKGQDNPSASRAEDKAVQEKEVLQLLMQAQSEERVGNYDSAVALINRALAIPEKMLGSEGPMVAKTLNDLAGVYRAKHDYMRAELLYQRALAIYEKVFGMGHPYVATCLDNLATMYHETGKYAKAEPLYRRVLTIKEQELYERYSKIWILE